MINPTIAAIRQDYRLQTLTEQEVAANPIDQFAHWWKQAVDANIDEVNAMTLATADAQGWPDARIVLLKSYDAAGFVFFTNYESAKGQQLAQNPKASLVFFWKELERQIRISGTVEKVDEADSDAYFASRPRGSQLGAWASPQSRVIDGRHLLDDQWQAAEEKFLAAQMQRPPHWGGYRVAPLWIEFWQGRSSRLHDRLRYTRLGGDWTLERLAP